MYSFDGHSVSLPIRPNSGASLFLSSILNWGSTSRLPKQFSRLLWFISLGFVPYPVFAAPAPPAPATIKINQCYLVYTKPIVPYVDQRGNFLVGAKGIANAIGATVKAQKNDKFTFRYQKHTLTVAVGRLAATAQNVPIRLPVAPKMSSSGQVIVPVTSLLRAFGLRFHWVQRRQELDVFLPGWHLPHYAKSWTNHITTGEHPDPDRGQLAITSLRLEKALTPQFTQPFWTKEQLKEENRKYASISLIFENVSHTEFPDDSVFIHIYGDGNGVPGYPDGKIGGNYLIGPQPEIGDIRRPNLLVPPGGRRGAVLQVQRGWQKWQPPNRYGGPIITPPTSFVLVWLVSRLQHH